MIYDIDFTVTLSQVVPIEADTREEALEISRRLLYNERFYGNLIEHWEEPYCGWHNPNEPNILRVRETGECYGPEELNEYYGFEV